MGHSAPFNKRMQQKAFFSGGGLTPGSPRGGREIAKSAFRQRHAAPPEPPDLGLALLYVRAETILHFDGGTLFGLFFAELEQRYGLLQGEGERAALRELWLPLPDARPTANWPMVLPGLCGRRAEEWTTLDYAEILGGTTAPSPLECRSYGYMRCTRRVVSMFQAFGAENIGMANTQREAC